MANQGSSWLFTVLLLLLVLLGVGGTYAYRAAGRTSIAPVSLVSLAPGLLAMEVAEIHAVVPAGTPPPALAAGQELVTDQGDQLVVTGRRTFALRAIGEGAGHTGLPALHVEVLDGERADLEAWTRSQVGNQVLLEVSGVTSRPTVHAPIPSGSLVLENTQVEPARYQREILALLARFR